MPQVSSRASGPPCAPSIRYGPTSPGISPHACPPAWSHLRLAEVAPRYGARAAPRPPLSPSSETSARRADAADALAVALRAATDEITSPLVRVARAFVDREVWTWFGYARLEDLARERFGRSGRWLRDLAALGRIFSTLPALEAAVCGTDGGPPLGRVAGLLVGRIADQHTLAEWVRRARALSVRELREEVAAARNAGEMAASGANTGTGAGGATPVGDPEAGDEVDRSLVRLGAPAEVLAAFDEGLDLFRAVEGHETTVTSFVEALVAESAASGIPVDPERGAIHERLRHGRTVALREKALARSTGQWRHLPPPTRGADWAMRLAGASLSSLRSLRAVAGRGRPMDLDQQLHTLLRLENEIEIRLAGLLAQMAGEGAWARLRFDSAEHYAEQRLGLGRTAARLRLRVARALRRLPKVREAYEGGGIGAESAWLVAKMLGPDSAGRATAEPAAELAWVERARRATVKRLRDEVRLRVRKSSGWPGGNGPAGGEGIETELKTGAPGPVSDAAWYASLHRQAGTAHARIHAMGIRAAGRGVSDVFLLLRLPEDLAGDLLSVVESARARLEELVSERPWDEPWPIPDPPGSVRAAREFFVRSRRMPAWVGLLALLEDFVETWDVDGTTSRRTGQPVFTRDGWRCAAPGCTSRRNLEVHHVTYRSRGGDNALSNRLTLCRFHHQQGEHGGLASCRGRAPLALVWALGKGGIAGRFRNEIKLPAAHQAGATYTVSIWPSP